MRYPQHRELCYQPLTEEELKMEEELEKERARKRISEEETDTQET